LGGTSINSSPIPSRLAFYAKLIRDVSSDYQFDLEEISTSNWGQAMSCMNRNIREVSLHMKLALA
jgi:hypothetical protein